jgi:hypothetical protein
VSETRGPEEIRRDIESTRRELGDTVEALSAKTDVKGQAQQRVAEARQSVTDRKDELLGQARAASPDAVASGAGQVAQKARQKPLPAAAAGAFVAGFVLGRLTRR